MRDRFLDISNGELIELTTGEKAEAYFASDAALGFSFYKVGLAYHNAQPVMSFSKFEGPREGGVYAGKLRLSIDAVLHMIVVCEVSTSPALKEDLLTEMKEALGMLECFASAAVAKASRARAAVKPACFVAA